MISLNVKGQNCSGSVSSGLGSCAAPVGPVALKVQYRYFVLLYELDYGRENTKLWWFSSDNTRQILNVYVLWLWCTLSYHELVRLKLPGEFLRRRDASTFALFILLYRWRPCSALVPES